MKKIFLSPVFIFFVTVLCAQTPFHSSVKIEFEKTVYVRQLYKALEPEWYERIKDRLPQTSITYYDFVGDTTKSLFKPGRETQYDPRSFYQGIADKNIVYRRNPAFHVFRRKSVNKCGSNNDADRIENAAERQ